MKITKHGSERMEERTGLSKSSQEKMFQLALTSGTERNNYTGQFGRYLDKLMLSQKAQIKIYGNFIYIYKQNSLITVLNVPTKYRKYLCQ